VLHPNQLPFTPPPLCSDDGRRALTFVDLLPYLLASCGTVQEALDFMDPTQLQVGGAACFASIAAVQ
jgi:penicillin V acylase-like amidase (Ntn superfamily)